MCGICGEWNPSGADEAAVAEMRRKLVHRGPDEEGQIRLGEVALGIQRLSVIDLEHGQQPVSNEDRTVWVVFNGEIYNYRELRTELESRGHRFRTRSDTEVIVHLYEEHGEALLESLRGMFAFALWDQSRRRLLLARDRFGQKPLFYELDGTRLRFASEVKAILAVRQASPTLDLDSLDDYLTLRFIPSPRTMIQGIKKLPPAHYLLLDASSIPSRGGTRTGAPTVKINRYWSLHYRPKRDIGEADAARALRERLRDAVESHLVADVPVGAYLSGGMDSSLIVAVMSQITRRPVSTFSVGVAESDFNELPFARQVAARWQTDHHEQIVSADLAELLPRMVYHLDEPSDPIAACMYQAAALAARHGKVVVTGDGGDEVFAGFDRYAGFRWAGLYAALPNSVRRALLGPLYAVLPDSGAYKNLTQKLRWLHSLSFHAGGRRYAEATAFFRFGAGAKAGLYTTPIASELSRRSATECIIHAFEEADADCDLDRMLQADVTTRLAEHSLMLSDRMTMAHGLEARSPYLDHHLAQYVATLPTHLKVRGNQLKYLMRRVAKGLLPESIVRRSKQGFMFPLAYWIKGPLRPSLQRLFADSALTEAGIFRGDAMARLLDEHLGGRVDNHVRLWMILNVEIWYRIFILGESIDALASRLQPNQGSASGFDALARRA